VPRSLTKEDRADSEIGFAAAGAGAAEDFDEARG